MEMSSTGSTTKRTYWDIASRTGSYAVEWYNSVTTWLGDWIAPERSIGQGRSEAFRVSETLMVELVQQGRTLEEIRQQKKKESLASAGLADYSWLVTEKAPAYDLSDLERLELEQLFRQVPPESCSRVVRDFRSALLREPDVSELANIMRAVVRRVLFELHGASHSCSVESKSAVGAGVSDWFGRNIVRLKSRFSSSPVLNQSSDDDLELGSLSKMQVESC